MRLVERTSRRGRTGRALTLWLALDSLRAAVLLTAVLVVATLAGAVARRRRNRVHWELSALHRGVPVRLFASTDQREFDQVCRAVQRALEHGERR